MVEHRETHEFIGDAGITPLADTGEVELAYHYLPSAWGQGFATEAAISILDYGLTQLGMDEIAAIVIPENVASWRVLEKAGMRYVRTASYYGLDGMKKYVADRTWQRPPPSLSQTYPPSVESDVKHHDDR
jgi:ribosomal-protein-alanine N-acetyltransferase